MTKTPKTDCIQIRHLGKPLDEALTAMTKHARSLEAKILEINQVYIESQQLKKGLDGERQTNSELTQQVETLQWQLGEQRGANWKYIQALSEILTMLPGLRELPSVKALDRNTK